MNIIITGASSGVGAALARHYAAAGVTLGLLGRNAQRLEQVAQQCRSRGAEVVLGALDVTDSEAMRAWLEAFDASHPTDLIIANAGISGGTAGGGESAAQAEQIFAVNVGGVLHTLHPLIPLMEARGKGAVAIVSSLAGMRGMPSAPAYSASKAAVKAYGEGLRGALAEHGISVTTICPGYIRTPLTDVNTFPMPFLMEAEEAAARIAKGIAAKKSRLVFPWPLYAALWCVNLLPVWLSDKLFAALPKKS